MEFFFVSDEQGDAGDVLVEMWDQKAAGQSIPWQSGPAGWKKKTTKGKKKPTVRGIKIFIFPGMFAQNLSLSSWVILTASLT